MPDPHRSPARHALLVALAGVLAWVWLSLRSDAPLHEDTSRDLAFARDLVDASVLHRHGAWASFAALEQGTTFIDLLALCRLAGLGFADIGHVMTTLLAASVALLVWAALQLLPGRADDPGARERGAIVAGLVLLAGLPLVVELPVLWQPTLLPLPLVLAHVALWRLLRDGSALDALALALFVALALDIHIVSLAFVPLAVFVIASCSRRPLLASLLAALSGAALLGLSSWDAWVDDLARLHARGWLIPLGVGLALVWLLGLLLCARVAGLAWLRRLQLAWLAEAALLLVLAIAAWSDATLQLAGRYLAPFVPALALALGWLAGEARTLAQRRAGVAVAIGLVLLASMRLREHARELPHQVAWTLVEVEPLALLLHERGLTWTELVGRLQGPGTPALLGMLASVVEPGSATPASPTQGLLVLALTAEQRDAVQAELPSDAQVLALADDLHVLVLDTTARADRLGAQLCREGNACVPVVLALTDRVAQSHLAAWLDLGPDARDARHRPAAAWLAEQGEPSELLWRLPIRRGEPATLVLDTLQPEHCAWHVVDVDGFEPALELPARVLELDAAAEGSVLVGRRLDASDRACAEHGLLPPAIIELAPAWTQLRALLQPRATRR